MLGCKVHGGHYTCYRDYSQLNSNQHTPLPQKTTYILKTLDPWVAGRAWDCGTLGNWVTGGGLGLRIRSGCSMNKLNTQNPKP